ncbi:tetratricopeptide repeat protein [Plantactinospora sp. S1510]|uniref:Tetratricopeptide repeat protein n=1 Tax=Plantactinospora alkalitolerans TaxID=2789879 RepID=A0ABS0H572_9ACTN|nr:tetratricopeptide repeat protein [Plantactinospora alkalitolerans]MBF9133284.1 tetratricopeptide repeat protein [Plantactinospora alkalitolerans]
MDQTNAERLRRAAVCRDAFELLLTGEPESAVGQLKGLAEAAPGAPYRIEAAFLLALAKAVPYTHRQLASSVDGLRIAAEGDHPIYTPAAKLLLAGHWTRMENYERATELWHALLEPYRLGYSAVAWFHIALNHERAGDHDKARDAMAQARATSDPQYAPKAMSWMITYYNNRGRKDRVEALAEIAFDFPDDPLGLDRYMQKNQHVVIGRQRLLDLAEPGGVLAGAQMLAQANGIKDDPLPIVLSNDLQFQPTPMPGVDLPWFEPYLRHQPGTEALMTTAHQALAYADYVCTQAAIQYLEQNDGPANVFANIVQYPTKFPWGPLMHESIRQRMINVLNAPDDFIPTEWPTIRNSE